MGQGRPRNTTRQREAGLAARQETRRRLLQAAADEFRERGYARATVSKIAARAGVTVQTLYLSWGSKRALLRAYLEAALSGRWDEESPGRDLTAAITAGLPDASADPRQAVRQIARLYRQVADRANLGWELYRDAAGSDPQIAQDWRELQHLRRGTFAQLIGQLPPTALRPGLTPASAADTAWAIASPETYELMVRTAGYSADAYEQWVAATLTSSLLSDESPAGRGLRDPDQDGRPADPR